MKYRLLIVGVFLSLSVAVRADSDPAAAAPPPATTGAACSARVKEFASGDLESKKLGARIWHLSRLAKAALKDACAKKLLAQGVKEETDYWHHIRDKFKCADGTGKILAGKTCSKKLSDQVKTNLNYLRLFRYSQGSATGVDDTDTSAADGTEATPGCNGHCGKTDSSAPLSGDNDRNLRLTAGALAAASGDPDTTTPRPDAAGDAPPASPSAVPPKSTGLTLIAVPADEVKGFTPAQVRLYRTLRSAPNKADENIAFMKKTESDNIAKYNAQLATEVKKNPRSNAVVSLRQKILEYKGYLAQVGAVGDRYHAYIKANPSAINPSATNPTPQTGGATSAPQTPPVDSSIVAPAAAGSSTTTPKAEVPTTAVAPAPAAPKADAATPPKPDTAAPSKPAARAATGRVGGATSLPQPKPVDDVPSK